MKVGLLATINDEGLPHLTLIASLQAGTPTQLVWAQFLEGSCKQFIQRRPQTGFLIMTLDRRLWRGQATFTHLRREGPEYEQYNSSPMFRYNAYFGIHTVYYMDLVTQTGQEELPMTAIVTGSLQTMLARAFFKPETCPPALNGWSQQLLNRLGGLKFLTYLSTDGYPRIIPVLQVQAPDRGHILFAASVYPDELRAIPPQTPVAVLGMSLDMEDVLVRGTFAGIRRYGGIACGSLEIDWVYNPMPPKAQQIYPALPLQPVTNF